MQSDAAWLRPDWPEGLGVTAFMTTRGPNYGRKAGDPTAVRAERAALQSLLGARPIFLDQVHGSEVVRLQPDWQDDNAPPADAAVSTDPDLAVAILVADCLPVLFAAPGGVAGAHAGWRGLAGGVLQAAPAKAKAVIYLHMHGGVSHVDTFDPKPELAKRSGQPAQWRPDELSQSISANRKWLKNLWDFKQRGQSGLWVSELLPNIARVADDLCVVRSMVGETPLHGAQNLLLHTGRSIGAAPSVGSWVSYGLGTENEQLPGYVLLNNDWVPNGGSQNFASAFLPATHQATNVRAKGRPVDNITPADPAALQRAKLDFLREQDSATAKSLGGSDAGPAPSRATYLPCR